MDTYNFWQDFFDTYQSLSDWMKVLWLVVPPASLLGLIALIMHFRVASKHAGHGLTGRLIYSIHRDGQDQFHVFQHGKETSLRPTLLMLDLPNGNTTEPQRPKGQP